MFKRSLALILSIVFIASMAMMAGCYAPRIAKNPNPTDVVADASQQPDTTETDSTDDATEEPVGTELPTDDANGTETVTENPTEGATEAPNNTDEATASPTEAATEAATEGATQKPTEAAGTQGATDKPTVTPTSGTTAKPTATPTPTPKPTATPTPKPTATPTPKPSSDFSDFAAQSINGYANFTNATFANSRLTMVNFWATWCGPCIEELPSIQRLSSTYAGRMQIVTVLFDSQNTGAVEQALSIMSSIGVTLPTYRCSGALKTAFTAHDNLSALPTTFFVDQNGHIVNIAKGGHTYEQWCSLINGLL